MFIIHKNSNCCEAKSDKPHRCSDFTEFRTLTLRFLEYFLEAKLTLMWNKNAVLINATATMLSCDACSQRQSTSFSNQNKAPKKPKKNLQSNTSNFLTEKISPPEPAFMLPTSHENRTPALHPCFPDASPSVVHAYVTTWIYSQGDF